MRIYDLTRTLDAATPVYPGDPEVRFDPHSSLAGHGFRVTRLTLGSHAGTHVDAPAHFLAQGAGVDSLALAALVGPARVVDAAEAPDRVEPGARLLIRSGWGEQWGRRDYFTAFPGLERALAGRLAAAPAALVGLETPSLHPDSEEDARLHRQLLQAGVVILENLAGLDRLPERVFLAALPLPLRDLDGSPCRAVAVIPCDAPESARE